MSICFKLKPSGRILRRFFRDRTRNSMIMGPLGSGKTFTAIQKILMLMVEQEPNSQGIRPSRFYAVRNTYPDLTTTTIKDWMAVMGTLGELKSGHPPVHHILFDLDDGTTVQSEMIFLALDREDAVKKLRGAQATGFWLNEVKELSKSIVDMADLRHGRYPSGAAGGVRPTWHGMIGDTNAPDEDNWYYELAEQVHPENWNFFRQPGGVIEVDGRFEPNPKAENLNNLPEDYYKNGLQGKSKDWILVNLANEYGIVIDGKPIYPEYSDTTHCKKGLYPNENEILYVGIDFGLTPSAVLSQYVDEQWRILDELVTENMGAKRFARRLKEKLGQEYNGFEVVMTGDPSGEQRAQTDEATPFMMMETEGVFADPAYTNDFSIRREVLADLMLRLTPLGEPAFVISPKAKTTRQGLAGKYKYRRIQVAGHEGRFRDVPDKDKYSHPVEAAQYGALGAGLDSDLMYASNDNWGGELNYPNHGVI